MDFIVQFFFYENRSYFVFDFFFIIKILVKYICIQKYKGKNNLNVFIIQK